MDQQRASKELVRRCLRPSSKGCPRPSAATSARVVACAPRHSLGVSRPTIPVSSNSSFLGYCHVRLAYLRQSLVRRARLRLAFKIQQRFARTTSDRLRDRFPVSTSRKNDNSRTWSPRQASPRVSWTCYHRRAQDWPALPRQTCRRCVASWHPLFPDTDAPLLTLCSRGQP